MEKRQFINEISKKNEGIRDKIKVEELREYFKEMFQGPDGRETKKLGEGYNRGRWGEDKGRGRGDRSTNKKIEERESEWKRWAKQ